MPSSTLLPTPEPANRPMRWPRPTVSRELIARTPTSSVREIGARSSGFMRHAGQARAILHIQGPAAVQRLPAAIDDAPEHFRTHANEPGTRAGNDTGTGLDAMHVARGHQVEPVARKTHDFGLHRGSIGRHDLAAIADGGLASQCLERQPDHAGQLTLHRRLAADCLPRARHVRAGRATESTRCATGVMVLPPYAAGRDPRPAAPQALR